MSAVQLPIGMEDDDLELMDVPANSVPNPPALADQSVGSSSCAPSLRMLTDVSSKLVDLKGIGRPPVFDGSPEKWPDFRFKFESMTSLIGMDRVMGECLRVGEADLEWDRMSREAQVCSKVLYNLLIQLTIGRALSLLKLVTQHHGVIGWKRLVEEYEPLNASRQMSMIVGILTPSWSNASEPFLDQLMKWERRVQEYEVASGTQFPDSIKCAVVARWSPPNIKQLIRQSPTDVMSSYAGLKEILRVYVSRSQVFSTEGQVTGVSPMEVDFYGSTKGGKVGGKFGGKGTQGPKGAGKTSWPTSQQYPWQSSSSSGAWQQQQQQQLQQQ